MYIVFMYLALVALPTLANTINQQLQEALILRQKCVSRTNNSDEFTTKPPTFNILDNIKTLPYEVCDYILYPDLIKLYTPSKKIKKNKSWLYTNRLSEHTIKYETLGVVDGEDFLQICGTALKRFKSKNDTIERLTDKNTNISTIKMDSTFGTFRKSNIWILYDMIKIKLKNIYQSIQYKNEIKYNTYNDDNNVNNNNLYNNILYTGWKVQYNEYKKDNIDILRERIFSLYNEIYNTPQAQINIAEMYLFGECNTPIDYSIASKHLNLSTKYALKGSIESAKSHFYLGFLFSMGLITLSEVQSISPDYIEMMLNSTTIDENNDNTTKINEKALGILHYTISSTEGSPEAQIALGYRHQYGYDVPKSCNIAYQYYNKVARWVVENTTPYIPKNQLRFRNSTPRQKDELRDTFEKILEYDKDDEYDNVHEYQQYHLDLANLRHNRDSWYILGQMQYYGVNTIPRDKTRGQQLFKIAAIGYANNKELEELNLKVYKNKDGELYLSLNNNITTDINDDNPIKNIQKYKINNLSSNIFLSRQYTTPDERPLIDGGIFENKETEQIHWNAQGQYVEGLLQNGEENVPEWSIEQLRHKFTLEYVQTLIVDNPQNIYTINKKNILNDIAVDNISWNTIMIQKPDWILKVFEFLGLNDDDDNGGDNDSDHSNTNDTINNNTNINRNNDIKPSNKDKNTQKLWELSIQDIPEVALTVYGRMQLYGYSGQKKNIPQAHSCFLLASGKNYGPAQFYLGMQYQNGWTENNKKIYGNHFVEEDDKILDNVMDKEQYIDGIISLYIPHNYQQAQYFQQKASVEGDLRALYNIAYLKRQGIFISKCEDSVQLLKKIVEHGPWNINVKKGVLRGQSKEYHQSQIYSLLSSEIGSVQGSENVLFQLDTKKNTKSQYNILQIIKDIYYWWDKQQESQQRRQLNKSRWIRWVDTEDINTKDISLIQKEPLSQLSSSPYITQMYINNTERRQKHYLTQLTDILQRQIDFGNKSFQSKLGDISYTGGNGIIKPDYNMALTYYMLGAKQNDPQSCFNIAWMYQNGFVQSSIDDNDIGINNTTILSKDFKMAYSWYDATLRNDKKSFGPVFLAKIQMKLYIIIYSIYIKIYRVLQTVFSGIFIIFSYGNLRTYFNPTLFAIIADRLRGFYFAYENILLGLFIGYLFGLQLWRARAV